MSSELCMRFISSKAFGQPGSLEKILSTISAGYEVSNIEVGGLATELFAWWENFDSQMIQQLGIAYEKGELYATLIERVMLDIGFLSFIMELNWTPLERPDMEREQLLFRSRGVPMFRKEEYGSRRHCEALLRIAKQLYGLFAPEFAWIEICKPSGYTTKLEVDQLKIPHIYWANFFSPAYVGKFGRDFLILAPGWKVEFLEDGGCLYVLSPTMKATPKTLSDEVKKYFGVEHTRKKPKPNKTKGR